MRSFTASLDIDSTVLVATTSLTTIHAVTGHDDAIISGRENSFKILLTAQSNCISSTYSTPG
jgi:hypothetical protein